MTMRREASSGLVHWALDRGGIRITITCRDRSGESEMSAVIDPETAVRKICSVAGLPEPWKAA